MTSLGTRAVPRAIGWMILGLGIGVVEGVYEKSPRKIRNGLIGGAVGGLLGGLLFEPVAGWTKTGSGMASRASSLVVLGMCIGGAIALAQVVLKEAWLTVLDGYRTGRQLSLTQPVTVLGRSDHLPMPFLGPMNRDLEPEHLRIVRRPGGSYLLEDNHSRLGTRLNNQPLTEPTPLGDGDVIRLGRNLVRFNQRRRPRAQEPPPPAAVSRWSNPVTSSVAGPSPPPPPVPTASGVASATPPPPPAAPTLPPPPPGAPGRTSTSPPVGPTRLPAPPSAVPPPVRPVPAMLPSGARAWTLRPPPPPPAPPTVPKPSEPVEGKEHGE